MEWPEDADGDAMRRLREDGFNFEHPTEIVFHVDVGHWPPQAHDKGAIAAAFPQSKFATDDEHEYLLVQLTERLTYSFVVDVQSQLSSIVSPHGGACDNWSVTRPKRPFRASGLMVLGLMCGIAVLISDLRVVGNGGGLISLPRVMSAVSANSASVDVDHNALLSLFLEAGIFATIAVFLLLRINLRPRENFQGKLNMLLVMAVAMIIGYALNSFYGSKIINAYMIDHGYSRCTAGDHEQGRVKAVVSFDNYTRAATECPRLTAASGDGRPDGYDGGERKVTSERAAGNVSRGRSGVAHSCRRSGARLPFGNLRAVCLPRGVAIRQWLGMYGDRP